MRMASSHPASAGAVPAPLGLWDVVSLIVGIIVGATIFQSPPNIFANAGSPGMGLGIWLLGGALSLAGALCYAELATAYPTACGDYDYITHAFGRTVGFAFAWSELAVIRTGGSIAIMGCVFAEYAERLLPLAGLTSGTALAPLAEHTTLVWSTVAVLALAAVNAGGLQPGRFTQNLLTAVKALGLGGVVVFGALAVLVPGPSPAPPPPVSDGNGERSLALALVFVLYAYGGWNEAAYVAAEVRDPRRNMTRALLLGTVIVTVLYVAVNVAYLAALGFENVKRSSAVAADVLAGPLGEGGARAMCLLVMVSALGAINGLLFTGLRLNGRFGADFRAFAWMQRPPGWRSSPGALAAQTVLSLGLIALVDFGDCWKPAVRWAARAIGAPLPAGFARARQADFFEQLVVCTTPVFWLFLLLTGLALPVLRWRDPGRPRPFRVPGYPWVPLVFCGSSLFMFVSSSQYAADQQPAELMLLAALLLVGIPLYVVSRLAGRPRPKGETP